ncbi:MAG: tripartite tricarboxylate transporter TctB family protein [Deltaproteobacteria bacterium]|nr:tripartite tricarboxylate transporter TctB family protein [Deltaproteobacteria bacterium]
MRFPSQALLTLFFCCAGVWALIESREWPLATRLFPWVIGILLVALCLIQIVIDLTRWAAEPKSAAGFQASDGPDKIQLRSRTINILSWILGYGIGIWLLGFDLALVLMLFGYFKFQSSESWRLSLWLTAAGYLFFWVIFDYTLRLPLPSSQVWFWIEKLWSMK